MSENSPIVQPPWKKSYYLRPDYLVPCIVNKKTIEEDVKNASIRNDDIFVPGYPKSGTNWTATIVEAIVNAENPEEIVRHSQVIQMEMGPIDHPDLFEAGFTKDMFPMSGARLMEKRPLTKPRVIKTHLRPEFMPDAYFERKPKTVLVTRNPKDVAVSLFNFHQSATVMEPVEWDQLIREYCNGNTEFGSHFQYTIDWAAYKEEPWIMFVRYEDIKQSPQEYIKKIANFLRKKLTDEQINEVARVTDFQFMKKNSVFTAEFLMRKGSKIQRKGIVGDWKNVFTVAENDVFDRIYDKKMEGYEHLKYTF